MRLAYTQSLRKDPGATLDDDREAVTTLEEIERTARRVFGGAHPVTGGIKGDLRLARSPEEWRAAVRGELAPTPSTRRAAK
jgi:hypothetical protein